MSLFLNSSICKARTDPRSCPWKRETRWVRRGGGREGRREGKEEEEEGGVGGEPKGRSFASGVRRWGEVEKGREGEEERLGEEEEEGALPPLPLALHSVSA